MICCLVIISTLCTVSASTLDFSGFCSGLLGIHRSQHLALLIPERYKGGVVGSCLCLLGIRYCQHLANPFASLVLERREGIASIILVVLTLILLVDHFLGN